MNEIREKILEHIIKEYCLVNDIEIGNKHRSYCLYPEEPCSCKVLEKITYDTPLIRGGYIDSFTMASTVVFIESNFDIKIKDIDVSPENFDTINKMVSLVEKYKKNK